MARARSSLALLLALALPAACGDGSGPDTSRATSLTIVSGANMTGVVMTQAPAPLAVRAVDDRGRPVRGVVVQFSIVQGGGSLSAGSATTDADGLASVTWTFGQTAGPGRAEARVQGLPPVTFDVVITAGQVASLLRTSPPPGTSAAGFELADSVTIRALDAFGNAVPGLVVNFAITQGGGTVSHAQRNTDAQGRARVAWTLGSSAGPQELQVSAGSVQTVITATADPCPDAVLAPGEAITIDAGQRCVVLPGPAAHYFVTAVNTAKLAGTTISFRVRGAGASPATMIAPPLPAAVRTPALRGSASRAEIDAARRALQAHHELLQANERVLHRLAPQRRSARAARIRTMAEPPALGDTLTLRIPTNFADLCNLNGAQTVRARVVFVGEHGVVLEDVASQLAGTIDTLYVRVGQEFDTDMWQLLNDNFGNPLALDAETDANERFFMLFSPIINTLQGGAIAGFVASSDFFPTSICPASNVAEIFYARVPTRVAAGDPYASGTPGDWYRRIRTIMIHEVKHIVSFAERLSRNQIPTSEFNQADRWLEESSAMLAEELWGRTIHGRQPESNTTYQESIYCEVRPDFPQCQPLWPVNMLDHFVLLHDYLANNETHSPIGAVSANDFTFYGSGWSFLRWVIDQYASSESAFLSALTTEIVLPGVQNIEARTGKSFAELISDWSIAQVMDDYPQFVPAQVRHQLLSWHTRDIFLGLHTDFSSQGFFSRSHPLVPRTTGFGAFLAEVSNLRGGSMAVIEVSGTQNAPQLFEMSGLAGANLPSDIRMNIIRVD